MGTGFAKKKKESKLMQQQFSQMQSKMEETEVVGTAGNGLVRITLKGNSDLKEIKIKPECVDPQDVEGLELLIKSAYGDAYKKLNEQAPALPAGLPSLFS